ncbi:MAG: cheBR, two-component system, chemotaxis family, CheB/CheR fusion protein [Verrucomicrobiales bacterium]|nr:cheBR, two-component system, chemotaxis family, CheB/CheR fusion protein [Verrucomicrobiales bacterium]
MALVLVQHLDPSHESLLTKLLDQCTVLPVVEVSHNTPIEPNHVYVIPPNKTMIVSGGRLKLLPRKAQIGPLRSIDTFLESLAGELGPRAIGVVLSGTASDGTIGLQRIKEEGGITFAQDDRSAKFDSMPRSAVSAGCVHFVMPPAGIASELSRIAEHSSVLPPEVDHFEKHFEDGGDYHRILQLIRNRTGVDMSLYKPATLKRRITRRLVLTRAASVPDYLKLLQSQPQEIENLYNDILINVTSFFRNPETFDVLKEKIFPQLIKNCASDQPLRVWVLGCSTGQEAYSIAMAYMEFAASARIQVPLRLFGTDVSEPVLEKARVGLYTPNLVQDLSPERLKRFFVKEEGGFRICKPLRDLCVFARHNVLSDPPFSRMHLLSCRNVMIYLEPVLQKKLIPIFHYALNPSGCLLLGSSETIGTFSDLFTLQERGHQIFLKKAAASRAVIIPPKNPPAENQKPGQKNKPLRPGPINEVDAFREADRVAATRFAPAGVLVNDSLEILQFRGQASPYLQLSPGKPRLDLLKMLREGLLVPVRNALQKTKKTSQPVRLPRIPFRSDHKTNHVHIEVLPVSILDERFFLVLFEPADPHAESASQKETDQEWKRLVPPDLEEAARENTRLRDELTASREYLQSVTEQFEALNEELQASNEEGQSANEELQSINEELETTKEELQSTNEELTTVNEEMNTRNVELHRINSDLNNVLTGVQMCIVVLQSDLTIRRFTPLAEKLLNLVPTDVGRPITNIRPAFNFPGLEAAILKVIETVQAQEEEVQDKHGRWYSLRIFPYRTLDNRIDGALLVLVDIDAQKRAAQRIQAALEYAEATLEAVRDPLLVLNSDLVVERANRSYHHTFRAAPAEVKGLPLSQVANGQWNDPALLELLHKILPSNTSFQDFVLDRDFERLGHRNLLLNARPIMGEAGKPEKILLAIEDVTERKQLEVLKESEHRFRTLAESLPQLVWSCLPPDGRCDYFNGQWAEYTGIPVEELLGLAWRECMHPEDRQRTCDYWLEAVNGKVPYDLDYRLRRKDGQYRWFKTRATPLLDSRGKVIKWFGTCTDIEDQKKAQLLLQESEQWLRLIMDSVKDFSIFTLDREGRINGWHLGAQRVFGYSEEEVLGQTSDFLFTPEDRAAAAPEKELETAMHSGMALDERWHLRKDGTRFFASGVLRAMRNENAELQGFTKVARDITERKRQEEELQKAHDELERKVEERTLRLRETVAEMESFSYSVSHDMRAPLRSIRGFASILKEQIGSTLSPENAGYLDRIETSINRLDLLIKDVLSYSRVSREQIDMVPIDLNRLIQEIVDQYPGFQPPKAEVRVEPLPRVLGYHSGLSQSFTNLFSNAIKFVPSSRIPLIKVWAEPRGTTTRICVEDNGIGIALEDQRRVFNLFERLHSQNSYEGTGIGLSIVRKAVERMEGRVGVESQAGSGARFWLELKLA